MYDSNLLSGVLLLLATAVGNGHGSENTSTSALVTTTPMGTTGHTHFISRSSQKASTTNLHYDSTTDQDGLSNGTTPAVTMSSLDSEMTPHVTSVASRGSSSMDTRRTIAVGPANITAQPTKMPDVVIGLFILIFLIAVIILLIVVIWCIRKKTRQYSFDLYSKEDAEIPLGSVGQGGVFAPNQNDEKPADFEYAAQDENGTAPGESEPQAGEERWSTEEGSEKLGSDDSFGSHIALTPKEKPLEFSFNLIGGEGDQSSDTSMEILGEPQNKNNNNPRGRLPSSTDFPTAVPSGGESDHAGPCETFTEISLDDPV